jgi:hypothetical protein
MYQPYPTSGKPVEPERPPAPASVLTAVKLMYTGAAITTVYTIVFIVTLGDVKSQFMKVDHKLTESQASVDARGYITSTIVFGIIATGLWLLMARANKESRNWARITATVLFGLNTLYILRIFAQVHSIAIIFPVLTWLVGAGAVFLLWRAESSAFFKPPGFIR